MAKNKTKVDLTQKTDSELSQMLKDLKKQMREASISVLQNKQKNLRQPRTLRKQIARVLTVLKQKEIIAQVK